MRRIVGAQVQPGQMPLSPAGPSTRARQVQVSPVGASDRQMGWRACRRASPEPSSILAELHLEGLIHHVKDRVDTILSG